MRCFFVNRIFCGNAVDVLRSFPAESVNMCVTSPPYYCLRDYGIEAQIGNEQTPYEYIQNLLLVFEEVKRVLKPDGTLWVNIADSYSGSGKAAGISKFPNGTETGLIRNTIHRVLICLNCGTE